MTSATLWGKPDAVNPHVWTAVVVLASLLVSTIIQDNVGQRLSDGKTLIYRDPTAEIKNLTRR